MTSQRFDLYCFMLSFCLRISVVIGNANVLIALSKKRVNGHVGSIL
jgi:hypothetical protein